jgi:putative spermidine/putrescine transport system permease protein
VSAFYENVGVLQYPIAAASAVILTLVLVALISLILRAVDIRREITR